jgi:cell division septum initiation protein DivIVA
MSMAEVGIFGAPPEDEFHPEFAKVLLGFDPRHVEEYVSQAAERIVALEQELRETRDKLEATRRRASDAREAVYLEIAGRMAEVMRSADEQAEKLRHDAEDGHRRMVNEALQEADQIRRDAEDFSERLRTEAEGELRSAKLEAARVLGALIVHRDALLDELATMRTHLEDLIDKMDRVTTAPKADNGVVLTPTVALSMDDLLGSLEGFELALPVAGQQRAVEPAEEDHRSPEPVEAQAEDEWQEGVRLLDLSELSDEGGLRLDPSLDPDDPETNDTESLTDLEDLADDHPATDVVEPTDVAPPAAEDPEVRFDTETVSFDELWEDTDEDGLFGPPMT